MHAQALTLAVLSGAAMYHYYEKRVGEKDAEKIASPSTATAAALQAKWKLNIYR